MFWIRAANMKKIVVLMFLTLMLLPSQAFAAAYTLSYSFDPVQSNYVVSYYKQVTQKPGKFMVQFDNNGSNTHLQKTYTDSKDITGIYYLTCNGNYSFTFWDGNGTLMGNSQLIVTSQTTNSCASYASELDQYGSNFTLPTRGTNVKLNFTQGPAGEIGVLSWPSVPSSQVGFYKVYRDGNLVSSWNTDQGSSVYYVPQDGAGTYSVATCYLGSCDYYDTVVSQPMIDKRDKADPWAGNYSPGVGGGTNPPGGGGGTTYPPFDPLCETCVNLNQLLQCPDWDKYMGEFTKSVKAALPPPPDWNHIADIIGSSVISKLDEYNGPVPDPPTVNQIKQNTATPLPAIDNSVPDAQNLKPTVPADYNQPKSFNLDDAPVIDIKDESKPFTLPQPLSNLQYDPPKTKVFPSDPRNNTGGINTPAQVEITDPAPKPVVLNPSPQPVVITPTPNIVVITTPTPTPQGGSSPTAPAIPSPTTGTIPIPRK